MPLPFIFLFFLPTNILLYDTMQNTSPNFNLSLTYQTTHYHPNPTSSDTSTGTYSSFVNLFDK